MISFELFKNGKKIKNNLADYPPSLKMFPEPTDVFSEKQSWLNQRFKPLFSFDVGEVNPDWAGQILHCVAPLYTSEGGLKYDREDKKHDYIGYDWYVFKLDENNKYELLADETLFKDEDFNPNLKEYLTSEKYIDEYVGNLIGYRKSKEYYSQHEKLASFSDYDKFEKANEADEILTLGGNTPNEFYYSSSSPNKIDLYLDYYDIPSNEYDEYGEEILYRNDYSLVNIDGNLAQQVLIVDMVDWFSSCSAYLFMLFEPKNKMVAIKLSFD